MNVERQPNVTCSQPPRIGAIAGASPNTIMMCDMIRCACDWSCENLSCTIACPITEPAPAASPCSARHTSSQPNVGANAAPSDDSVYTVSAIKITGRRPNESDSVP